MASTMDDCVLDFDIDLLQLPKYDVEKAHKSIVVTKTKLTSTNSLLKKYYNKGVICKSLEDYLLTTKESYKQVCIERIELREKCATLEEEIKKIHDANRELQDKYVAADNKYDGIQAHSKQLELLIKDNETAIESLKIENRLEKSASKDFEKKCAALQKENDYLIKNISRVRDIIFGKKKATKEVKLFLNKYGKSAAATENHDDNSSDEVDAFEECLSPLHSEEYNDVLGSPAGNKDKTSHKLRNKNLVEENVNTEDDSESSNEVVSMDTGRGSSLAFSDSDKCSLSPEYFINDSPLSAEVINNKHKMVVSIASSPISTREFTDVATSPIIFKDTCFSEQTETDSFVLSNTDSVQQMKVSSNQGPIIMIDRVVSPINTTQHVDMSTSTDNVHCDIGTSPLRRDNRSSECSYVSDHKHKMVVSIASSPISTREFTDVATSPIIFKDTCLSEQTETDRFVLSNTDSVQQKKVSSNQNPIIMIDRVVSPINTTQHVDMSTSTDNVHCDIGTSPLRRDNRSSECSYVSDHNSQEKECLDLNNINNLVDDSSNDGEIEMIFDRMRFNQQLITPIPTTPAKPRPEVSTNIATQTTTHTVGACPDAAKIKEENTALQVTVAKLAQEIMNINNILSKCCPSLISETGTSHEAQKISRDKYLSKEYDAQNHHQKHDPKTTLVQNEDALTKAAEAAKKDLSFKGKLSRLKDLFDDTSSTSPIECHSPQSALPPDPPAADVGTILNDINVENVSFKSKERLHFEDPLLNEESSLGEVSDNEIYEHEIVVELTPDSQESDRHSLHEILMEQQLNRQAKPEERPITRTPRAKKLTRLEKLRKNMAPKSKIKGVQLQEGKGRRKLRVQPKRLTANKERVLDPASAVNDKAAYEKACKVMAELKSKEKMTRSVPAVTPKKGSRKRVEDVIMSSPVLENDVEINRSDESIISDTVVALEKLTPNHCSVEAVKKLSEYTNSAKCYFPSKDSVSPGFKTSLRTRSKSKCYVDNEKVYNSGGTHFDTNHLKSPALKRYGRNRFNNKSEIDAMNNNNTLTRNFVQQDKPIVAEENMNTEESHSEVRKRLKRPSVDKLDTIPKRILRSSSVQHVQIDESSNLKSTQDLPVEKIQNQTEPGKEAVSYDDLDVFCDTDVEKQTKPGQASPNIERASAKQPKPGILCAFIDKYGIKKIKNNPKISENAADSLNKLLEDSISEIQKLPPKDTKYAMDKLVEDLKTTAPNNLLSGLIKFLKEPARKIESYNKINVPPAPPMTKTEQILIYIVSQLKVCWPDIVENILNYIDYTLFVLNRTPDFEPIETLSHFYAILCRYNKNRNRLRLFIIDAMYCLQFKAVPLIKQCLDVWMHILPLAHLGLAKNPLVICLVYLLHFYKCEDRFNRVQEIRNILHRKYFYEVSEWNEPAILEIIRNSILELRDIAGEKKMLRMSLIILAKRNGARWCQKHIIKNMLLPIIEQTDVPDRIKQFCVALLGPLLKPYPMDMKINCEIVMNQLFDILERNPSPQMQEAIYTSLIYMSRHNQYRVMRALLRWTPENVSPEFEDLLRNYVKERPVKSWKQIVSKIFILE